MNVRNHIAKSVLLAIAVLAAPAFAADGAQQGETSFKPIRATTQPVPIGGYRAIELLALETDLTPKQVLMVERVAARRTEPFLFLAEKRMAKRFESALGEERYSKWANGHPIPLYSPAVLEAVRGMAKASPDERNAPRDLRAVAVVVNP